MSEMPNIICYVARWHDGAVWHSTLYWDRDYAVERAAEKGGFVRRCIVAPIPEPEALTAGEIKPEGETPNG